MIQMMTKLFSKTLLLAAVIIVSGACNENPNLRSGNFIECGNRSVAIAGAVTMNAADECMLGFYSEGLVVNGIISVRGKGDVVHLQLSSAPGTYIVSGNPETYPYGDYLRNFTSENLRSQSDEEGELQAGTVITWSREGDVVTVDIEGTYLADVEGASPQRFKLHYSGEPVRYAL